MVSKIRSMGLSGIDGYEVLVECFLSNGLPAFEIVGLPDAAVKESKERVRAAIKNTGFEFPAKRITINLAPASMRKEGPAYDLPIAIAVLSACGYINITEAEKSIFIGELSLDGNIRPLNGVLPMVISAYKQGYESAFVPQENAMEAAVIDGINVYSSSSLKGIFEHFQGANKISPCTADRTDMFKSGNEPLLDFADVKGQENAKRALEIAAAGGHNIVLIGSPGTGKTMLAKRLGGILPDLTFEEALEVTKIHSIAGTLKSEQPLITNRPFRSPHHTISPSGLSGGGSIPKPGELSLAHNGVLFLDELPEFGRDVLEVMRQPLEDGEVTISRVNATLTYPCNIMLICSMNPCKCGYYGDPVRKCTCTRAQVNQYRSKVSGPLLDRIDLQIEVAPVDYRDLSSVEPGEPSSAIKERVNTARRIQLERYRQDKIYSNSQLSAALIRKYCRIGDEENRLLKTAFDNLGLSARAHSRILKVARTIADLAGEEKINCVHIAEAIQYRSLDRKYFE